MASGFAALLGGVLLLSASSAQAWITLVEESATWLGSPALQSLTLDACAIDPGAQPDPSTPEPFADDKCEKDVAVGDVDGDGDQDIVIVRKRRFSFAGAKDDLILLNDGGALQPGTGLLPAGATDARDVWVGDLTGDGLPEISIATTFEDPLRLYKNSGGAFFSAFLPDPPGATHQYCALAGGDLDGDGTPDLFFANYNAETDAVFVNNGFGDFQERTAEVLGGFADHSDFGTSAEILDMDADGDGDLLLTRNIEGTHVYFDHGFGAPPPGTENPRVLSTASPYMSTAADLNGDELLDVYVVSDFADQVQLASASGGVISYQPVAVSSSRTDDIGGNVKAADLDADGDDDVGVSNADVDFLICETEPPGPPMLSEDPFALLENDGAGNLSDPWPSDQPFHAAVFDHAFVDLDQDGCLDLFLAGCEGYRVFINEDCDQDGLIGAAADNCPRVSNPGQQDTNGDGIGDACQCGDMTGDGRLSTTDSRLVQLCLIGQVPCGAMCDVNGNQECDSQDATMISQVVVGILDTDDLRCFAHDPL